MGYDPLNLLDLCKSLCQNKSKADLETLTRTIISRAYYSAFLHSREYLKEVKKIQFTGTGDDHIMVENQLKNKVNRQLGSVIRTLRENRLAADYNLNNPAVPNPWNSFGRRFLTFGQSDQKDSIRLAEYITNNLYRP